MAKDGGFGRENPYLDYGLDHDDRDEDRQEINSLEILVN